MCSLACMDQDAADEDEEDDNVDVGSFIFREDGLEEASAYEGAALL